MYGTNIRIAADRDADIGAVHEFGKASVFLHGVTL
jgi:hypothetical protein